jgi:hypothetical protein
MRKMGRIPFKVSLLSLLFFLRLFALLIITFVNLLMILVERLELYFPHSLLVDILYGPVLYLQFLYLFLQLINLLLFFIILFH